MRRNKLLLLAGLCCLLGADNVVPERLHFAMNGFSIAPLEGDAKNQPYELLMMLLPATDAYQPNVRVDIQPYSGTLDNYILLSKRGFIEEKFKLLGVTKVDEQTVLFEYAGFLAGNEMHWYAKAVLKSGRVYLATATTMEPQWASAAPRLKACVESLQLDQEQAGQDK